MVESVGAQSWFLPPYSPDLNPIEKMWSKIKSILRTLKARTEEALINAIAKTLEAIMPAMPKDGSNHVGIRIPYIKML